MIVPEAFNFRRFSHAERLIDLGDMGNKLLAVVNAVFAVLTILGVVTDPTTAGITDSIQALGYTEPKKDKE